MTAPGGPPCLGLGSSVDLGRCGRRPCSRGGGAPQGLLYPEFQHRPPPPSYQASMQEYRLRLVKTKVVSKAEGSRGTAQLNDIKCQLFFGEKQCNNSNRRRSGGSSSCSSSSRNNNQQMNW